jgi:uncharacterized protein YjdB
MSMTRSNRFLSVLLAVMLFVSLIPISMVEAAATRTPIPPEGAPSNTSSVYFMEGENGAMGVDAGIGTDHAYSGTGFGIIGGAAASKITYNNILAPVDGNYKLAFNYIAGPVGGWETDRSINLYVNGSLQKTVSFVGTSTWDDWQYLITDVELIGGYNTIAIEANGSGNGICVDYFYYWDVKSADMTAIRFEQDPINVAIGQSRAAVVQALSNEEVISVLSSGVVYTSNNDSVASVTANTGIVTGKQAGTATITAAYNSFTATTTVSVGEPPNDEPIYPHPNAQIYQAEAAVLSGGAHVASNHTGYTGSGFVAGYDNNGSAKTTFTLNAPSAGEYYVSLRYSAGDVAGWPKDRTVGISVNSGASVATTVTGTEASWNTWREHIIRVQLNEGTNTLAVTALTNDDNSDAINLDKISVWAYHAEPVVDAIAFNQLEYVVSENNKVSTMVFAVNANGVQVGTKTDVSYSSSNSAIAAVDANGEITGVKAGTAVITAVSEGMTAQTSVSVKTNPTVTVDYDVVTGPVNPSRFGYILTPNYDVADSRLSLLGPLLNRETIPVQNFQAIHDLNSKYYDFEDSVMQRSLEAYNRAKSTGLQWYFLLGMNPSWATASGGPIDTLDHSQGHLKTAEQDARFKQYIKDVLQYFKDNGAKPDFANLTNEYWTGLEPTFKGNWEAVREVFPDDIPVVGPSGVGYHGIPDFYIPFANENNITLEGPSWHEYWTADTYASLSQLQQWHNNIADLQAQYPATNGQYIIWEENNAGSTAPGDWTRSMANVIRTGVDYNIKGTMQLYNSNGVSDLMQTNQLAQNRAIRTTQWWVYYMFAQLSGQHVEVTTDYTEDFTAAASKDDSELKIIFAKNNADGSVNLDLRNQPFSGQDIQVDLYKVTSSENNGLEYQYSVTPSSTDDVYVTINNVGANEAWLAIIKKVNASPSFFFPMTPDDGEAAIATPTLTWSTAQGATSYTVTVSENKDLSNPVIRQQGLTGTSYTVETPLTVDRKYYWSVTAVNGHGSASVSHDTVYSFVAKHNSNVPSQFGPHLPTLNAPSESVTPVLSWSRAYNATSYRVVVSKQSDMSNPVVNVSGITNLRVSHFGPDTQGYYQLTSPLEFDTKYYWTVFAVNANGERPMNGPDRYFTTKAAGNQPSTFNLIAPGNGESAVSTRAVFSWETSKNAFFYKFEVSPNADMSNPIIVRDRMIYNKYTTEPNVLLPGTKYYWKVTAYSKDLQYAAPSESGVYSFTTEAVPSAPLLYAQHADGDSVKLWFQPSVEATSYKIKYGTAPGNYTETIDHVTGTSFEVKGLPNATYYFAVLASNDHGDSSIWNERAVTVTDSASTPIEVTGVALDQSALTLKLGATSMLKATVAPGNATNRNVAWTTSDNQVATVDQDGKVTGVAVGTATITATTMDGGFTATATVSVENSGDVATPPTSGSEGTGSVPQDTQATVSDNGEVKVNKPSVTNGTAAVKLGSDLMLKAINNSKAGKLVISVDSSSTDLRVEFPAKDILAAEGANIDTVELVSALGTVKISINAIKKAVQGNTAASITIIASTSNMSNAEVFPSETVVHKFSLLVDGQEVEGFVGKGDILVEVPYKLKPGEAANKVVMYGINADGKPEIVKNGKYNAESGMAAFKPAAFGKFVAAYADISFNDVKQAWAKEPIETLAAREIVSGSGNGNFKPDGKVTRAEFIAMLINMFDLADGTAATTFSDVGSDKWYYEAIASAQQLGIIQGKPNGSFGANEEISRQDMAVMAYKAAQIAQLELTGQGNPEFKDNASISGYAQTAVAALSQAKVVNGMGNGAFAPQAPATRAQAAVMICNLLRLL